MDTIISKLDKIIINFKKSGAKGYQEITLKDKLNEINLLEEEFNKLVDSDSITEDVQKHIVKFDKAKKLFEEALVLVKPSNQKQSLVNMAQFNLETAIKIVPLFSGDYKELSSFLTIVELINNTLEAAQKSTLINFVYNAKLTSAVRTSLGTSEPETFEDLKKFLSIRYKSNKTISQIQATLSNFSQRSMNVNTYHEKLLEMIAELNELQIKGIDNCDSTQSDTIKKINGDYALNIFKNGLKGELKSIVFASRPKELNEALQLALELEKEFSNSPGQIFYFSNNNNRRNNSKNFNNDRYSYNNRRNNANQNNNINKCNNNRSNNNGNSSNGMTSRYNNTYRPNTYTNSNGPHTYNNRGNRANSYNNNTNNQNATSYNGRARNFRNNRQSVHCVQGN